MNEIVQRINAMDQRTQAQGEPPLSADQTTPTPTTTSATVPTPASTSVLEEQTQRPRYKLPEMKMFTGKRSNWRAWKNKIEEKLDRDRLAIGDRKDHFAYINACLDDTPAKMVLAYVERQRINSTEDPGHFMTYLNSIYGNTNTKEYAVNKLNMMSQGKEAFAIFLPKFETTLADAGGGEWTDEVKINTLKRTLNQEMRKSFIYMPAQPTEYSAFIDSIQTLASRLAVFDRGSRKPAAPTVPKLTPLRLLMIFERHSAKSQRSYQCIVTAITTALVKWAHAEIPCGINVAFVFPPEGYLALATPTRGTVRMNFRGLSLLLRDAVSFRIHAQRLTAKRR